MRLSVNGNLGGESLARNSSYYGSASASRTTEAWKINFSASASYRESRYDFGDGEIYTTHFPQHQRQRAGRQEPGPSLVGRWPRVACRRRHLLGISRVRSTSHRPSSTTSFPYAESTRRLLTVHYSIGATNNRYRETTLYDKDSETLGVHTLAIGADRETAVGPGLHERRPVAVPDDQGQVPGRVVWQRQPEGREGALAERRRAACRGSAIRSRCRRARPPETKFSCGSASWRRLTTTGSSSASGTPSVRSTTTSSIRGSEGWHVG